MEWLQKEEVRELEWEMSIEPLYKELWDPYSDLCEQTLIIQQAYPDKDDYLVEMKRTIEDKWEIYFAGRHLQYGGIY